MRYFRITNSIGESVDVTSDDTLLTNPEGLGIERDTTFRRVGNRFITVSSKPKQLPFSGKILFFGDDPYAQYKDTVRILSKGPLYLEYNPFGKLTTSGLYDVPDYYTKKCELSKLTKTELDNDYGCLWSEIELIPLTPWYIIVAQEVVAEDQNESVGNTNMKFPFTFPVKFSSTRPMQASFDFTTSTMTEGACRLRLKGPFENPVWHHYVGSREVSSGRIGTTKNRCVVHAGEYLWVDNTTDPYRIFIGDEFGKTLIRDVYQLSDFSTERFITIQPGYRNDIVFSVESASHIDVRAEVYQYYESV